MADKYLLSQDAVHQLSETVAKVRSIKPREGLGASAYRSPARQYPFAGRVNSANKAQVIVGAGRTAALYPCLDTLYVYDPTDQTLHAIAKTASETVTATGDGYVYYVVAKSGTWAATLTFDTALPSSPPTGTYYVVVGTVDWDSGGGVVRVWTQNLLGCPVLGLGGSHLVMVSGNDTTPDYLEDKLEEGDAIGIETQNEGGNETSKIGIDLTGVTGYNAGADQVLGHTAGTLQLTGHLVMVSGNDTTPAYLEDKLEEGDGIGIATQNDGGNETSEISIDLTGVTGYDSGADQVLGHTAGTLQLTGHLVMVSANDKNPGYLEDKREEGDGIGIATQNEGSAETSKISIDLSSVSGYDGGENQVLGHTAGTMQLWTMNACTTTTTTTTSTTTTTAA